MRPITLATLRQCPKAELHYHLDGSLRVQTILELAKQDDVLLPTTDEAALTRLVRVGAACESLVEYLEAYRITLSVLQTRSALARCSFEAFELCHGDGVSYVEGRFCPSLHLQRGLSPEAVLEAVLEGGRRAERELAGLRVGVIVCAMRHHPIAESVELAHLAARYADKGVVGFDIAGPEAGFPAAPFAAAYDIARTAGLGLTAHAGEADGWQSVDEVIKLLGVSRVGHGVALRDSGETRELVRERRVCVESCVTSNTLTKAVGHISEHPAKSFVESGIALTLATDGVTMTDTTLSQEYHRAHTDLGFSAAQIVACIEAGFMNSFQPQHVRLQMAQEAVTKARHILNA